MNDKHESTMNHRQQSHADPRQGTDEELVNHLQQVTFDYFWYEANTDNGLVADSTRPQSPASVATVGFALTIYPIAVERGFITRSEAATRTLITLRFLLDSPQGTGATASG